MPLIVCEDCRSDISDKASVCPKCGNPDLSNSKPSVKKIYTNPDGSRRDPFKWELREEMKTGVSTKEDRVKLNQNEKSMVVGLLLTFFFGPLGLLYTNIKAGLILTVVTVLLSIPSLGLSLGLGWIGSMIWAAIDIGQFEQRQAAINGKIFKESLVIYWFG